MGEKRMTSWTRARHDVQRPGDRLPGSDDDNREMDTERDGHREQISCTGAHRFNSAKI